MDNPCACEKDRSLCGGACTAKNPYSSGFGLRSANSRGFAPITPRPRPEQYGFFHWLHERPVRKQEGSVGVEAAEEVAAESGVDTCHTLRTVV